MGTNEIEIQDVPASGDQNLNPEESKNFIIGACNVGIVWIIYSSYTGNIFMPVSQILWFAHN